MIQLSSPLLTVLDIFYTFHVVQREMIINNNNNSSFCNVGGEVYSKTIKKLFLNS
jgi:hypothetical protein